MKYIEVPGIIFRNKQDIPWKEVENYLKRFIGRDVVIKEYGNSVHIPSIFPDEYTESKYTKKLRGALAKAKANASQVIPEMLENATNRRWNENKDEKHRKEASGGWYRYDVAFSIPINNNGVMSRNFYNATAVVMIKAEQLYLYDIINIKKEASTPHWSKDRTVENRFMDKS